MAAKVIILGVLLVVLISLSECSWLQDAMQSEERARALRALEKRRLLNELEVEEEEEEDEEELNKRYEEADLYNELQQLAADERKRQEIPIRQTPVPAIKRLKMTPPPNAPYPIYRLDNTPMPPSDSQRRPTPKPGEYPYNLVNGPLRQTPKPFRPTPAQPNKLPVEMSWEEKMWQKILRKRAQEAQMEREEELERRYRMPYGENYDS